MFNSQSELRESIAGIKGVGRRRLASFSKCGVRSCFDLLSYFPVGYDDFSKLGSVADAINGEKFCIKARIVEKLNVVKLRKLRIFKAVAVDENNDLFHLVFFNNEFCFKSLKLFEIYVFFGKIERFGAKVQMVSPRIVLENERGLVAKYGLTAGLSSKFISEQIKQILACFRVHENLPKKLVLKFNLVNRHKAFFDVHFPSSEFCLKQARKRLIFEELFFWQLSLKLLKKLHIKPTEVVLKTTNLSEFLKILPFELSSSQVKVVGECVNDCCKNVAMNRLIQGDVGCGKTVIVQALCYLFARSGFQVAVMAPTEILARQHYTSFEALFSRLKIKVGLLVGSLKKNEQSSVLNELASGRVQILVGTHSLFSDRTVFKNLGLVVADEQHRFGVLQRDRLIGKGQMPHVLIMSATPVPRTLAMVFLSNIDVSVVEHAPIGRAKTKTFHVPPSKRLRVFSFVAKEVAKGHQAYIVCPLIEDGVKQAVAVEPYFEKLKNLKELKGIKIAMMHGKQTSEQKIELMNSFKEGKIDVLVATSMVEVGIDNSNATVIVVESAELFGLASLHQLRGRVGRGSFDSFCILISSAKTDEAKERMQAMCRFENGFDISQFDLKLRGPGQFFGTIQHGMLNFKIASLKEDFELLQACSNEAEEFLNDAGSCSAADAKILKDVESELKSKLFAI